MKFPAKETGFRQAARHHKVTSIEREQIQVSFKDEYLLTTMHISN